jgi:chlorophyll synthase
MEKIKEKLSLIEITPIQWLVSFSGVLMVRFFLETLSDPTSSGIAPFDVPTLIHYFLFFLFVDIAIILLLQIVIPTWRKIIPQLVLFSTAITYLAPIVDWVVSGGKGFVMTYIIDSPVNMLRSFLTFFGGNLFYGVTIGMRVEIIIVVIAIGFLVYRVSKNLPKSLFSMLMTYLIIFISGTVPGIIPAVANIFTDQYLTNSQFIQLSIIHSASLANNIFGTLRYESYQQMIETGFNLMIGRIFLVLTIITVGLWFYKNFRKQFIVVFKNLRPERIGHYIFLVILGVVVAYNQVPFSLNWNDWLVFTTLILSFFLSCMYAISVNDIEDVNIDRISSKDRPLPSGALSQHEMKNIGIIFLVLALVSGYLSGYYAFFCVLIFNALYYIYSAKPIRFKRVPILSAFIIGLCCLTAIFAGFFTFSQVKIVSVFPDSLIVGIVGIFFLAQHIKDLKDIEGDRAEGIITIPTMFGPVWGARIVGILVALAYFIVPLIMDKTVVIFGVIPAAVASYLIAVKKPFIERPIFIVYGLFALFILVVLILKSWG